MKDKEKKDEPLVKRFTKMVKIGGKKYELKHPGMRFVNRWRRVCTTIMEGKPVFDTEQYIDLCFENCVTPVDHDFKPDQDNIVDPKEGEEWTAILLRFLRGGDIEDFSPTAKKQKFTSPG